MPLANASVSRDLILAAQAYSTACWYLPLPLPLLLGRFTAGSEARRGHRESRSLKTQVSQCFRDSTWEQQWAKRMAMALTELAVSGPVGSSFVPVRATVNI